MKLSVVVPISNEKNTHMETGYGFFKREVLEHFHLRFNRFGV